jgi:hypothetical protein
MKRSHVIRNVIIGGSLVTAAGAGAPAQAVFSYPDFTSTAGLALNGVAVQTGPTLSITPPVRAAAGSVWYSDRVPVSDFWSSDFEFRIREIANFGADGFAFVIQNSAQQTAALGSQGGALGYAGNPVFPNLTGIANALAVEFDMWNNQGDWDDFNSGQHISVQCRGVLPNSPAAGDSMGAALNLPDLSDGAIHRGRIEYLNGALNVYVDLNQVLSVNVDLAAELSLHNGTSAFVGMTASTGASINIERHELLSWDFNVIPNPAAGGTLFVCGLGLLAMRRRGSMG